MVDCGSITVREAFAAARVSADNCSGLPSEANPGGSASVNVDVSNNNATRAAGTVEVTASGQTIGSADFNVPADGSVTVTVPLTLPANPGDYTPTATLKEVSEPVSGLSVLGGSTDDDDPDRRENVQRERGV